MQMNPPYTTDERDRILAIEENDLLRPRQPPTIRSILISYDSLTIVLTLGLFLLFNLTPPFERPFDINDKSIGHPKLSDFVPILWVGIFALVVPLVLTLSIFKWDPLQLMLFLQRYVMGGLLSLALTEMIKVTAGRLRPDFLDRCKPVSGVCTGDAAVISEGRKSFVSGHASSSFYVVTFLVLWMWIEGWARLGVRSGKGVSSGLVLFFTLNPFMICMYVAISRTQV